MILARVFLLVLPLYPLQGLAEIYEVSTTAELRAALVSATKNGEDDTVRLMDGIYKTSDDSGGTFYYVGEESHSLTLSGSNRDKVILSGSMNNQILSHNSTTENSDLILENISFINGSSDSGAGAVDSNFNIIVRHCYFENNSGENGGAIKQWSSEKTLSVDDTVFRRNSASRSGGAIMSGALLNIKGSDFLDNETRENNGLNGIGGGAIYSRNLNSSQSQSVISESTFTGNVSLSGSGGALNIHSVTTIENVTLFGNSTSFSSGAIYGDGLTLRNALIKDNSATLAYGAGWLGVTNIINTIITDNSSGDDSVGVVQTYRSIVNSLIVANSTGITSNAALLANNIIFGNGKFDVQLGSNGAQTLSTLKNNYVDEMLLEPKFVGSGNIFAGIERGFVDELNDDYRLSATSGLIDMGTTDIEDASIPDFDFDGNARIQGGTVDIGPFEHSPPPSLGALLTLLDSVTEFLEGNSESVSQPSIAAKHSEEHLKERPKPIPSLPLLGLLVLTWLTALLGIRGVNVE